MTKKVIIEANSNPLKFQVKEVWGYKDLCKTFVKKNFITRYKQTIFGPFYMVLAPLVTSGLFTLIFGEVVGVNTQGVPNFLFFLLGNLIWTMFSKSFTSNSDVFLANANVMGKVYFPRMVVPISNLLTVWIDVLAQIVLLLIFLMIYGCKGYQFDFSVWIWLFPLILLQVSLLGCGLGLLVNSFSVKYRDCYVISHFAIKLFLYVSPILYPISSIQNKALLQFALWNPLAPSLELARKLFFGSGVVTVFFIGYSLFTTAVVLFLGMVAFHKTEKNFIDKI